MAKAHFPRSKKVGKITYIFHSNYIDKYSARKVVDRLHRHKYLARMFDIGGQWAVYYA